MISASKSRFISTVDKNNLNYLEEYCDAHGITKSEFIDSLLTLFKCGSLNVEYNEALILECEK